MRLKSIELEAFRLFGKPQFFDLDGDVVLLLGRNGFGKTSVFDGISWCLFGSSPRLGGTRDFSRAGARFITNAFREAGEERVRLQLRTGSSDISIERKGRELSLFDGSEAFVAEDAQRRLLELLGFDPGAEESPESLRKRTRDSFSRSFLLHQDFLSRFVTSDNPRERFNAFADLFSLTPIRDFYTHLSNERSKASEQRESASRQLDIGSAELNQLERQLADEETRLAQIVERIATPRKPTATDLSARLKKMTGEVKVLVPDFIADEGKPLDTLDTAVLYLSQLESQLERKLSEFRSLQEQLPLLSRWEQELRQLEKRITVDTSVVQSRQAACAEGESKLRKLRESLTDVESEIAHAEVSGERLDTFLSDATAFVESDECPVCLRPIDRETLLRQLHERLEAVAPTVQEIINQRKEIQSELQAAENRQSQLQAELRKAERDHQRLVADQGELQRSIGRARQLWSQQMRGVSPEVDIQQVLEQRVTSMEERSTAAGGLRKALNDLRPFLELIETRLRLRELRAESRQQNELARARRARVDTYRRVEKTLDALVQASRRAERSALEEFIGRFRKPIQDAYSWLSPHPLFTHLDFDFGQFDEAGEFYFRVSRGDAQLNPSTTFSAAQANALALVVFLSLNASQDWCPLELALIDDPLQNMDDVNVLNLVDLIRDTAGRRQLVLSTSVPHLHRLLKDKLYPRHEGERSITHRFEALTEEGPVIEKDVSEYRPLPRALPELLKMSA
jgi:DNA repair exonuclease SbcCD ATPase subunit